MRVITATLILLLLSGWNAQAQTFAPEFEMNNAEQAGSSAKAETMPEAKDAADAQAEPDAGGPLVPAVSNIGDKKQEKVYDNSMGHVIEYKYVNGKVIFGDPDDRKVLVYIDDFKVEKGMSGLVRCSMRIYVLNDMTERINNLSLKLIWPEIKTTVQMSRVNPGVRTYQDIMLLGEGCFSMDKTPTIEVNRCRVKGKTQEQCADAVRWFRK